jgi:hypothetical protein
MERKIETRDETIARLLESRDLLFKSMIKFGCFAKCHRQLFARIDKQLIDMGVIFEEGDVE